MSPGCPSILTQSPFDEPLGRCQMLAAMNHAVSFVFASTYVLQLLGGYTRAT